MSDNQLPVNIPLNGPEVVPFEGFAGDTNSGWYRDGRLYFISSSGVTVDVHATAHIAPGSTVGTWTTGGVSYAFSDLKPLPPKPIGLAALVRRYQQERAHD